MLDLTTLLLVFSAYGQALPVEFSAKKQTHQCKEHCLEEEAVSALLAQFLPDAGTYVNFYGPSVTSAFSSVRCARIPIANWVKLMMFKTTFSHKLKFGLFCNIEGTLNISPKKFPIDVKVRNLGPVQRIKGTIEFRFKSSQGMPGSYIISVWGRDGEVYTSQSGDKPEALFNVDYFVIVGPSGAMSYNGGGQLALWLEKDKSKPILKDIVVDRK